VAPPPPPPGYGGTPGYGAPGYPDAEPPLDQPYYGAPLPAAVRRFFTKYVVFSGRASRSEFWWWFLVSFVISGVLRSLGSIHGVTGGTFQVIAYLWNLAILIPGLALAWRRLHDANHSGLNFLWVLLPVIGWIILLVFYVQGPRPEGARFDR
jgi:uncharacterized membrane protein YhaH (DUF805 family)